MLTMGVSIIVIESDFEFFQKLSYTPLVSQFNKIIFSREYRENQRSKYFLMRILFWFPYTFRLSKCLLWFLIGQVFDFSSVLQYLISTFVKLKTFFPAHALSPSCDAIPAAPFIDSALAYLSTAVAWLIIIPVIYEFSKTFAPHSPKSKYIHDKERESEASKASMRDLTRSTTSRDGRFISGIYDNFSWNPIVPNAENRASQSLNFGNLHSQSEDHSHESPLPLSAPCQPSQRTGDETAPPPSKSPFMDCLSYCFTALRTPFTLLSPDMWFLFFVRGLERRLERLVLQPQLLGSCCSWGRRDKDDQEGVEEKVDADDKALEIGVQHSFLMSRDLQHDERKAWVDHSKEVGLSSYLSLVQEEAIELLQGSSNKPQEALYVVVFFFLLITCAGHYSTKVGRSAWRTVGYKYLCFLCICCGYWGKLGTFDEGIGTPVDQGIKLADVYEIEDRVKIFGQNVSASGYDANYGEVLKTIIAPRLILLQVVPGGTFLSTIFTYIADCPLFVFDEELRKRLFLPWDSVAADVDASDFMHSNLKLRDWLRALSRIRMHVTTNRYLNTVIKFYMAAFAVMLLYIPNDVNLQISFLAVALFTSTFEALACVIWLGKAWRIKDISGCAPDYNSKSLLEIKKEKMVIEGEEKLELGEKGRRKHIIDVVAAQIGKSIWNRSQPARKTGEGEEPKCCFCGFIDKKAGDGKSSADLPALPHCTKKAAQKPQEKCYCHRLYTHCEKLHDEVLPPIPEGVRGGSEDTWWWFCFKSDSEQAVDTWNAWLKDVRPSSTPSEPKDIGPSLTLSKTRASHKIELGNVYSAGRISNFTNPNLPRISVVDDFIPSLHERPSDLMDLPSDAILLESSAKPKRSLTPNPSQATNPNRSLTPANSKEIHHLNGTRRQMQIQEEERMQRGFPKPGEERRLPPHAALKKFVPPTADSSYHHQGGGHGGHSAHKGGHGGHHAAHDEGGHGGHRGGK